MTPDKFAFVDEEMNRLRDANLLFAPRTMGSPADGWMTVDGRRVLNFCANNYLGLANHPALKEAAKAAVDQWGAGPAAVRPLAGTQALHLELEARLARFKGVESALFVGSGFVANQAVIPPLVGREDVIFSDRLNHASIIDGARLSGAKVIVYEHNDVADCEAKVKEHLPQFRRGLLVTDGVFSMDGDIAPLDKLTELAGRYGLMTMVDDAHGEGVLGRGGRGIVDHFGLHGVFDIEIGTLSKAFGVIGGVIAGRKRLVDYIRQKARPLLFSSATTPADTAACLAAVDLLEAGEDRVKRLWDNTRVFSTAMRKLGFDIGNSQTPIVPVMLGEAGVAKAFSRALFEAGVYTVAISFPAVPQGKARVRVMNTAAHTPDDLEVGLAAFEKVGREMGVIG